MFKVVILVTRKQGMSRADFVHHYETVHAPLVRGYFPQLVEYRRNYIDMGEAILSPQAVVPGCDSITEMWFDDRAGYDQLVAANDHPVIGPALADDAAKFMDLTKTSIFFVDERGASAPQ
jgi:uncharacterized protein (TIGR02118 family)